MRDTASRPVGRRGRRGKGGGWAAGVVGEPWGDGTHSQGQRFVAARGAVGAQRGMASVGTGAVGEVGGLVAGLSISAPADFLQNGWVEQLCRTAAQISASLGYDASESNSAH